MMMNSENHAFLAVTFIALSLAALAFTACGDDSSSVNPNANEESSSSISISYGTLTDDRDGQTYKTVTIGKQTWMAENLNYAYSEGLLEFRGDTLDSISFCYLNDASNCAKYGRLYLWSAAMDSAALFSDAGKDCGFGKTCSPNGAVRGVCPNGWHLPGKAEWDTLFDAVGGSSAGQMLKSASGWNSDGNGTDAYGFAVLPAGDRSNFGDYSDAGYLANFWSSTESDEYNAVQWSIGYFGSFGFDFLSVKNFAYSVRCLRDSDEDVKSSSNAKSSSSEKSNSSSSVILSSESEGSSSSINAKSSSSSVESSMNDDSEYDASAKGKRPRPGWPRT